MQFSFIYVFLTFVIRVHGLRTYYTALQNVVFTDADSGIDGADDIHSEYYFGRCTANNKTIISIQEIPYEQLKGQLILRAWLPGLTQPPSCVYVRARSPYGDLIRYHAFKFNFCIGRLTYIYWNTKYDDMFYEWYIPVEMNEGIKWEIIFYK